MILFRNAFLPVRLFLNLLLRGWKAPSKKCCSTFFILSRREFAEMPPHTHSLAERERKLLQIFGHSSSSPQLALTFLYFWLCVCSTYRDARATTTYATVACLFVCCILLNKQHIFFQAALDVNLSPSKLCVSFPTQMSLLPF